MAVTERKGCEGVCLIRAFTDWVNCLDIGVTEVGGEVTS